MTDFLTKQEFYKYVEPHDKLLDSIMGEQQRHHKYLFGNGEPGLDEQIRNISAWIVKQEEIAKRRAAWWDKLQWVVIPIVIAGFITFVYQAFIFYFKIVPLLEAAK